MTDDNDDFCPDCGMYWSRCICEEVLDQIHDEVGEDAE